MFTLILTFTFIVSGPKGAVAVDHVPGFSTKESCIIAANDWLKQAREVQGYGAVRALCVYTPSANR